MRFRAGRIWQGIFGFVNVRILYLIIFAHKFMLAFSLVCFALHVAVIKSKRINVSNYDNT